ncbi:hypothetical protein BRADI_2g24065v3 [Brachypodium distachyon]|uniref:RING-type domain-containing protein n=1 Tax=Brachypodium distachyon TaxID=15368 RepID=A0A2K2DA62_BRADI|nr:hypothetical protein BRADI_2g24065v3 [Brachypodium distachyon]
MPTTSWHPSSSRHGTAATLLQATPPQTSGRSTSSSGARSAPRPARGIGMLSLQAGSECAICLAELVGGEQGRVLPRCRDGFHAGCIGRWLAARPTCPTCRQLAAVAPRARARPGGLFHTETQYRGAARAIASVPALQVFSYAYLVCYYVDT